MGCEASRLAILAGAIGALALPPFNIFAAMFVSFTLLVWLLDGATGDAETGRAGFSSSFWIGWLFGLGYFVCGLWWLGNALPWRQRNSPGRSRSRFLGLPRCLPSSTSGNLGPCSPALSGPTAWGELQHLPQRSACWNGFAALLRPAFPGMPSVTPRCPYP